MQLLELTLDSPAENLALDEALLLKAEEQREPAETLRLWEPRELSVVVGSSSRVHSEVRVAACQTDRIAILRRSSGGAAIVTGPGCLMYAVILSLRQRPELKAIDRAHRYVLDAIGAALTPTVGNVVRRGTSDLAVGERKFSGNSLRVKREHLLYHGTLLYDFPLDRIGAYLAEPPRQPDYRLGRNHGEFVANLPLAVADLRVAISQAFAAVEPAADWPRELTERLAREKFSAPSWTDRL